MAEGRQLISSRCLVLDLDLDYRALESPVLRRQQQPQQQQEQRQQKKGKHRNWI